jgi:uncharacterized membrane protein YebE (DUF533 family)
MKTTNILLGAICAILLAGLGLMAYPKYEQWQADRMAAKAVHDAAEEAQTRRTLHSFSSECKGRENEPDCRP